MRAYLPGFFKPWLPEKEEVRQEVEAADMVMQSSDGPADLSKIIPKHIIVAWWDQDITDLAKSLAIFAPNGSSITVICSSKPEVHVAIHQHLAACRLLCLAVRRQEWCQDIGRKHTTQSC